MQRVEFRAMGGAMLVGRDSDTPEAAAWLAEAPLWFEEWERHLSRFRPQSELSALNRTPGRWVPVSAALWAALGAGLAAAEATGGLVTPTLLDAVEAAGYTRDFAAGTWADEGAPAAPPPAPAPEAWRRIERDERRRLVRLPAGVRLDLGGIAKGWAADEVARRLGPVAPTLVDAGGDIAVSGPMADGSPWPVAVDDPQRPGARLDLLLLTAGGVATSGRDYRRWRQGEGEGDAHHIIDPRTGAPARTDALSATVVAPSAAAAEAGAKTALIQGSDGWAASCARNPTSLLVLAGATVLRGPAWTEIGRASCR